MVKAGMLNGIKMEDNLHHRDTEDTEFSQLNGVKLGSASALRFRV
jgi:hypothetical protein